jgi:hypothetical protein
MIAANDDRPGEAGKPSGNQPPKPSAIEKATTLKSRVDVSATLW